MIRLWFLLLMTFAAAVAHADTPAFDRPGIAFSPSTLPAGTFDWEQGLPDVTRTDGNGTRSTLFSADTLVRIGLTPLLEVQLSSAPINHLRSDSGNATGVGDSGLAIKATVPLRDVRWRMAVLGGIGFDTGDDAFTSGATSMVLASATSYALDENRAVAGYVGLNRARGRNTWTLSPNFSVALSDRLGGFVEGGATYADGNDAQYVAGGGLTWMLTSNIQLDGFADFGLNDTSPTLRAGVGVSTFFP